MTTSPRESLREYFLRELEYLRRQGAEFARAHPRVAGRLELGAAEIPDPHVERLIESFAFLTARLQLNIDNAFPELPAALLGVLYPQFTSPVPSMAVACFQADPAQARLAQGFVVPRHAPLVAETGDGRICRLRSAYEVTLWPLTVEGAGFEPPPGFVLEQWPRAATVLRIRLATGLPALGELAVERLRFFLSGHRPDMSRLYELLCTRTLGLAVRGADGTGHRALPGAAVSPAGFGAGEAVLPYPANAHPAYRLLQEYGTFPEKFLFVDFEELALPAAGRACDVLVVLSRNPGEDRLRVDRETFCLGATPVINLFPKTTEPVRVDQRRTDYRLVGDIHREPITEIHSILSVSAVAGPGASARTVAPFFSFNHDAVLGGQRAFWYARRTPSPRADLPGTELRLAFVDLDFQPTRPSEPTVYAHVLCSNRDLARQLPVGAALQPETAVPARISVLTKPTERIDPPLDGATLWRLVSQLSLNHLSLEDGAQSLAALRELLRLHTYGEDAALEQAARGIVAMDCRRVVRHLGEDAWRGFCRGIEISLRFDEARYAGSSAYLLASVLNRFFALYAPVDSFTELVIHSTRHEGIWTRWPPMTGNRPLL